MNELFNVEKGFLHYLAYKVALIFFVIPSVSSDLDVASILLDSTQLQLIIKTSSYI